MASITGIVAPNPVQENTTGTPITLSNVQQDDFFVVIASAGGTQVRPSIAISGTPVETLADATSTPSYAEWRQACHYYWWGWPWWRPYYYWYYWNGYCHWYWGWYYGYCGYGYYCYHYISYHYAISRVQWLRAEANGSLTVTATMAQGSISRFTVYHFRTQTQSAPGKVVDKVSWVLRTPQAVGSGGVWRHRHRTNDFALVVAAGDEGGTISATPNGGSPVNLVNYTFTHGQYVRTLVRLDWVTSNSEVTYSFSKANVSQFLAGYSVDLRERYAEYPTTGNVYWVAVPVRVNSNMQHIYPKELEQLLVQASTLDPVNFGHEFNFTRGNLRFSSDQFGQVNVESYEELQIWRLPQSVQIAPTVGDILLTDSELEAFIRGLKRGWIA